jgi:hypothetical protein
MPGGAILSNISTLMFVYGNLNNLGRAQRAIKAIQKISVVTVFSNGDKLDGVNNVIFKSKMKRNIFKYFDIVLNFVKQFNNSEYAIYYANDFHSALPMLLLKKWRKSILIYDAYELYIPIKGEPWNLYLSFFHLFEKEIINKSDLIFCAHQKRAELMKDYYGLKETPIAISNVSKLQLSQKYQSHELDAFFAKEGKTIVYAGVLNIDRELEKLIKSVATLSPMYKLLVVGDGPDYMNLRSIAESYDNLEFYFTGKIPYNELGSVLSRCDVGYVYYPTDSLNNTYCAPNKVYEYSSVNLPMLGNRNESLISMVSDSNYPIGYCSDNFEEALEKINDSYDVYVANTYIFNTNNDWSVFENIIINKVSNCISNRSK